MRVWRRQSPSDPTFAQLFTPDLKLDTLPVYCVKLGPMRGPQGSTSSSTAGLVGGGDGGSGDAVMVVHTKGNGRVSAWRLVGGGWWVIGWVLWGLSVLMAMRSSGYVLL